MQAAPLGSWAVTRWGRRGRRRRPPLVDRTAGCAVPTPIASGWGEPVALKNLLTSCSTVETVQGQMRRVKCGYLIDRPPCIFLFADSGAHRFDEKYVVANCRVINIGKIYGLLLNI